MTPLHKPVTRKTDAHVRDQGKERRIIITLYPGGTIGLRPENTRREEWLSVEAAWSTAVKQRLAKEKADQPKARRRK